MSKNLLQKSRLKVQDDVSAGHHQIFVLKSCSKLSIALDCYLDIFSGKRGSLRLNTDKIKESGEITLPTSLFPSCVH